MADDNMRDEILNREEPMATEDNVAYEPLQENDYAEIWEYAGEVDVMQYDNNGQPQAENKYDGTVEVKTYNDPVPPPRPHHLPHPRRETSI